MLSIAHVQGNGIPLRSLLLFIDMRMRGMTVLFFVGAAPGSCTYAFFFRVVSASGFSGIKSFGEHSIS
jgi:hypothetical protein